MRIFSDTPRDRPVFDAYPLPLPQPENVRAPDPPPLNGGLQPPAPAAHTGITSPFQLPANTDALNIPADLSAYGALPNPLAQDMFASYFPPQAPPVVSGDGIDGQYQTSEDFLSKVFNFGWDPTANGGTANGAPMAQGFPQDFNLGTGSMPFEGWNAHGWMA